MTEATEERMTQRVETLLRQAEDFRRHGEDGSADTALAKAEQIMLKHSIDQAVIAARLAAGTLLVDEIVTDVIDINGIYRKALVIQLGRMVQAYTSTTKVFVSTYGNTERLNLVGYKSEVDQLNMLIASIMLQAIAGTSLWWKQSELRGQLHGMEAYKARRQFVWSFVEGATTRIARARRAAVQEATDSDPGTALALRTREDEVDEYVNSRYRLTTARTRIQPGAGTAAVAGYQAGQRANTGDTPVGSNRRQIGT